MDHKTGVRVGLKKCQSLFTLTTIRGKHFKIIGKIEENDRKLGEDASIGTNKLESNIPLDNRCSQTFGKQPTALDTHSYRGEVGEEQLVNYAAELHKEYCQMPDKDEGCAFLPSYPVLASLSEPRDSPNTEKK